jgi:hypothetical protein
MADLLETSSNWLGQMRKTHLSRTVVYSRNGETAPVLASKGKTHGEISTEEGLTIDASVQDWLIEAADLAVFDEPEDGDRIIETVSGANVIWEVHSPGEPEPTWRWADSFRKTYRIHCVEVSD